MNPLYEIEYRTKGVTTFLCVKCKRAGIEVRSSEKVIPPIVEYTEDGTFKFISPQEIILGVKQHPYKPNSPDFNAERLADKYITDVYKELENFPTLPTTRVDGVTLPHPVAEHIYKDMFYFRPESELAAKLKKIGYVGKTELLPQILEKVVDNIYAQHKIKIDLFSVPKKEVGSFGYLGDKDGYARPAKTFSFGLHRAIPSDRLARELGALKEAERFINQSKFPFALPQSIRPFVAMLKVAIVGCKSSMLDGGDLYPSSLSKIACNLSRDIIIKDLEKVPKESRKLEYRPFKAGIEVVHVETSCINELEIDPGTIRLIFPSGVKLAAQYKADQQAVDMYGDNVDILLDFETFQKKGAVACFAMLAGHYEDMDLETCKNIFLALEKEYVYLDGMKYEGYVGYLPVMRPNQRYTELSKASNEITVDLVAKAILNKNFTVNKGIEQEYQDLVNFRTAIEAELKAI